MIFTKISNPVSITLDSNSDYNSLEGDVIGVENTDAGDFLVLDCGKEDEGYEPFGIVYVRVSKIICVQHLGNDE